MNIRIYARWIAVLLVAFAALVGVSLAMNPAMLVRARPQSTDYTVGGACGATIQACISNPIVQAGDRILIPAGTYTESLTLDKAVSLLGVDANTTIIHAVSSQRVMTVTSSVITASTVISGLMFTDGNVSNSGGGIWLTSGAQPLLQNVVIANNYAYYYGGGIYADSGSPLTIVDAQILSNTAGYYGIIGNCRGDQHIWRSPYANSR